MLFNKKIYYFKCAEFYRHCFPSDIRGLFNESKIKFTAHFEWNGDASQQTLSWHRQRQNEKHAREVGGHRPAPCCRRVAQAMCFTG